MPLRFEFLLAWIIVIDTFIAAVRKVRFCRESEYERGEPEDSMSAVGMDDKPLMKWKLEFVMYWMCGYECR